MIELTRRGMDRQEAHESMRLASMQALEKKVPLAKVLSSDEKVMRFLSPDEVGALLDPLHYIGTAPAQVERLIRKLAPLCRVSV
ncbi:MAG: adenylosuccinate lyase [Methanoregulaceae archaeon PtaU1.Bin066]|nr:MAG: adenylosuccinate lyase [Methanoregulaceae archaeon PtaU1.Bin066]